MKYVYAALLLHASGQKINEENVRKILTATGGEAEEARIRALVAALSEVNIDEAIKAAPTIASTPAPASVPAPAQKKEEKEEKREEKKEEAIAGLGALFQ